MFEKLFDSIFNPVDFFKKNRFKIGLKDSLFSLVMSSAVIVIGCMPILQYLFLPLSRLEIVFLALIIFLLYVFSSVGLYLIFLNPFDKYEFSKRLLFSFVPFMFLPIPLAFLALPSLLFKIIGVGLIFAIFIWTFLLERLIISFSDLKSKGKLHILIKLLKDIPAIALLVIFMTNNFRGCKP